MRDARVLALGGAQAVIVENLGDAPFAELVEPHVTAMLAVVAQHVLAAVGQELVVGVNALRNDGLAALGAAAGSGAGFVRINVLTGAMVTDQGVIQGRARETLLYRNRVGAECGHRGGRDGQARVPVGHGHGLGPVCQRLFWTWWSGCAGGVGFGNRCRNVACGPGCRASCGTRCACVDWQRLWIGHS